jgi:hypothetical protein
MNMNTVMNAMFFVLAAAMMFAVIVRLLFHASYREPEGHALNQFLDNCRSHQTLRGSGFLGWIDELLYGVKLDRHELRQAVEQFRRRTEWCHAEQKIFGSQATAIGMLFTLVSLTTAATGTLDPTVVIAVGVMSSVYGLVIAIPGTMLHDMLQRRVDRFLDQADAVLAALDAFPDVPMAAVVAAPAPAPIPVRIAPQTSANGQAVRGAGFGHREPQTVVPTANAGVPIYRTRPTTARSDAVAPGTAMGQPDPVTAHAGAYAAYDDNFDEQVLDWVSEFNREGLDHD